MAKPTSPSIPTSNHNISSSPNHNISSTPNHNISSTPNHNISSTPTSSISFSSSTSPTSSIINYTTAPVSPIISVSPSGTWNFGPSTFQGGASLGVTSPHQTFVYRMNQNISVAIQSEDGDPLISIDENSNIISIHGKNIKSFIESLIKGEENLTTLMCDANSFWRELAREIYKKGIADDSNYSEG